MSNLVSANWNNTYGMDNPKNVLNKNSHFGALPINQNYIFFNNGATRMIQNHPKLTPEIKKALEDERIVRGRGVYGSGTIRPIGFTEIQMSDLLYNSYGIKLRAASAPPILDPLTLALLTTGVGSLVQLLGAFALYGLVVAAMTTAFSSNTSFQLVKLGYSDVYTYKEIPINPKDIIKIINRAYPSVSENEKIKVQTDKLINLSSKSGFKKTAGVSSYDTILSKYQFNGGGGFFSSWLNSRNRGPEYIENLLGNLEVETSQIEKLKNKFSNANSFINNSQNNKKQILKEIKNKMNVGASYLHVDFLDYMPVLLSRSQKGYPNPAKEKSIFGPYICRSKKAYLYYPKIVFQNNVFSTLYSPVFSLVEFLNVGFTMFGGYPDVFSASTFESLGDYIGIVSRVASLGSLPTVGGACDVLGKDQAFNLGAGYSDGKTDYKPYKACAGCP
jgi:hypothetical protein